MSDSSRPKIDLRERFPNMRPVEKAPALFTMNGIGVTMFGRRDADPETGTYIKTHCFCVLYIPLLALGSYRVADGEGNSWYFLGKEPLSHFAKGWNYLVLCLALASGTAIGWNSYVTSPDYVARQELRQAKAELKAGDALKAAGGFGKLVDGTVVSAEARQGLQFALEQCLQSPSAVTNEGAFRLLAGLGRAAKQPTPLVPDAFRRGLSLIEKQRTRDPEAALRLFQAVSALEPKDESLPGLHIALLKEAIAARPEDTNRVVELALLYEKTDQPDECHKLLMPIRTKLGATEGARILGQHLLREGRHEEAYGLLHPYVQTRLAQLHAIERTYTNALARAYEESLDFLRKGRAPQAFYTAYDKAPKAKQEQMVDEFIQQRMKNDPTFTRALHRLTEANQIVHVTLDLGIVQLNRAQGFSDPALRKKELEEAEKSFLAIRGLAGETDEYRLFLGQVYYWLGRSKEGRELFDQLLKAKNRSYAVLMSLGSTLREVGEEQEARTILEEAYQAGKTPRDRHAAASVRAAAAREIADRIVWLERTDTSTLEAQTSLNSARGMQARQQGRNEAAADFLRKAIAGYESMNRNSATLNNAGLACLSLYEVTGRIEDQDRALRLLEQALALEPGNSILLINLSHLLISRAVADVCRDSLRLDLLREDPGHGALAVLYDNESERAALFAKLRANENMKKAFNYLDKALLLAPKDRQLYLDELYFLAGFEDLAELQKLQQRLANAALDTADLEKDFKESLRGTKDREHLEKLRTQIKKYEALRDSRDIQGHAPTFAYVACALNSLKLSAAALGERVNGREILDSASDAFRRHRCAATSHSRIAALSFKAQEELAAQNTNFAALARRSLRHVASRHLITFALERGDRLADEAMNNPHVRELMTMRKENRQRYPTDPSVEYWAAIHNTDPAEAAQIATAIRNSPLARLLIDLEYQLAPLSSESVLDQYWIWKLLGDPRRAQDIYQRALAQGLPLPALANATAPTSAAADPAR